MDFVRCGSLALSDRHLPSGGIGGRRRSATRRSRVRASQGEQGCPQLSVDGVDLAELLLADRIRGSHLVDGLANGEERPENTGEQNDAAASQQRAPASPRALMGRSFVHRRRAGPYSDFVIVDLIFGSGKLNLTQSAIES